MKTFKIICFSVLFVIVFSIDAFSQKETLAGVNINADLYSGRIRPSAGLTLEKRFTKHSGLETGLFYRTSIARGTIVYSDSVNFLTYQYVISQRFFNIPVLYKYYSKVINVSAGPTLDFYRGWKQKGDDSQVHVNDFDEDPKVRIGFLGKVSKAFTLSKRFVLEPELRLSFLRRSDEAVAGVGLAGKYKF